MCKHIRNGRTHFVAAAGPRFTMLLLGVATMWLDSPRSGVKRQDSLLRRVSNPSGIPITR